MKCRVPACQENHQKHYCKVCKDSNSNHFSRNCQNSSIKCKVNACNENHYNHYCKVCKDSNSNHFSRNCSQRNTQETTVEEAKIERNLVQLPIMPQITQAPRQKPDFQIMLGGQINQKGQYSFNGGFGYGSKGFFG